VQEKMDEVRQAIQAQGLVQVCRLEAQGFKISAWQEAEAPSQTPETKKIRRPHGW
jgi:hypothetical protein